MRRRRGISSLMSFDACTHPRNVGKFEHARRHQFSEDRIPSVLQSVLAIDLPFHVDAAMVVSAYAHKCLKFVRLLKKLSSHIHAPVCAFL